jgi:lipoyl(octanoyl) transferase
MGICEVIDTGRRDYDSALELQEELLGRKRRGEETDYLVLVEHDPVVTIGRKGTTDDLRVRPRNLEEGGIELRHTTRGGATTYHGPGQLVGYPIIDLRRQGRDVHMYLRRLESCIIRALAKRGIRGTALEGKTGVWVGAEKIASIGIAVRSWITYHGFAVNVAEDVGGFDSIFPCGMPDCRMTSVSRETGTEVTPREFADDLVPEFAREFGFSTADAPHTSPTAGVSERVQMSPGCPPSGGPFPVPGEICLTGGQSPVAAENERGNARRRANARTLA